MSRPRPIAYRGIGAFALISLFTLTVVAQQSKQSDTTMFLMVRAGPTLGEAQILSTLKKGLKESKCTITGEPKVRTVSAGAFEEVEALINPGERIAVPEVSEGVRITTIGTREPMIEFRLPSPRQLLKKLTVTYQKAGAKDYIPTAPDIDKPLSLIVPGRYALKLEPDEVPQSYEATVLEFGKKEETLKGEWPASDRYYIITMKNFEGDRAELFKVMQDGQLVANPLDNIKVGSDNLFVIANMESLAPPLEDFIEGNRIVVKVPSPKGRNPKRVWMYFPLSDKEYIEARDRYRKFDTTELPKEIRKEAIQAQDVLSTDGGPKWLEIKSDPDSKIFSRILEVKDIAELSKQYPKVYRLLVWEFDNGSDPPEAIRVAHPTDGSQLLLEQRWNLWADPTGK